MPGARPGKLKSPASLTGVVGLSASVTVLGSPATKAPVLFGVDVDDHAGQARLAAVLDAVAVEVVEHHALDRTELCRHAVLERDCRGRSGGWSS